VAVDPRGDGAEGTLELGVGDVEGEVVDGATEFFEGVEEDFCLAEVSYRCQFIVFDRGREESSPASKLNEHTPSWDPGGNLPAVCLQ
jgi:hypothetical protein